MLVGVVVGAIVAGFGQVVNAWLQDKRGVKRTLREERRRAYVGMIGTSAQFQATWDAQQQTTTGSERLARELVDARKKSSQVRLVAPFDTASAAALLLESLVGLERGAQTSSDVDRKRDAFVGLAQRDLEIST